MSSHAERMILVVDDEATQRRLIETQIAGLGFRVMSVSDGQTAIDFLLGEHGGEVGAVVLDLSMPDVSGLDVLRTVRPRRPRLPIIMLTAHSSVANAVESMRAGANDFLIKPTSADRLKKAIQTALSDMIPDGELRPLSEKLRAQVSSFEALAGTAPSFTRTVETARRAAATDAPVLIEGESGVGKEMFAQAIHAASPRADKPFIVVNCGALTATLVESILFGHEKGSFTGAIDKHIGKFEDADGGSIFLDEIGELPLDVQVKLLRVLQERVIEPVGSRQNVRVNVRLISATNRTLSQEVSAGRFREDLFYRLNVVQLTLPPLRQRVEDIPVLARLFVQRIAATQQVSAKRISEEALSLLKSYHWPGNVRQLNNAVFRAMVLSDGEALGMRDFPQLLAQVQYSSHAARNPLPNAQAGSGNSLSTGTLPLVDRSGHVRPLLDIEADVLRFALTRYRNRMSEIARRLGIGRSTLYRKMAELEEKQALSPPSSPH